MAIWDRLFRKPPSVIDKAEPTFAPPPSKTAAIRISPEAAAWARHKPLSADAANIFAPAPPPPGVDKDEAKLAMDEAFSGIASWGQEALGGYSGLAFGATNYAILSELAQRPEYRKITETLATEATRKWIKISAKGDEDKIAKVDALNEAFERYRVREVFRKASHHDGYFGKGHVFIDLGASDEELGKPIGNGRDKGSQAKIGKKSLKALRNVEPLWVSPQNYNASNPLAADWYNPQEWRVQGRSVHASRLLRFVSREVPDILKPAYQFGGVSMSQMAQPYIENFIRTRQSVSDLLHAFTVWNMETDLQKLLANPMELAERVGIFNGLRDNHGLMLTDMGVEKLNNISAPLGGLDALLAQSQEQMASVASEPLVKLLGISPGGLNASSEGEIRVWYDHVHSYQEHFYKPNLDITFAIIQISEFGAVDPDLTYSFEPLWALSEKELAEVRKTEAETGQILVDTGVISQQEERKRIANDPETPYQGLDADEMPDLLAEQEEGLAVKNEVGEADLVSGPEDAA